MHVRRPKMFYQFLIAFNYSKRTTLKVIATIFKKKFLCLINDLIFFGVMTFFFFEISFFFFFTTTSTVRFKNCFVWWKKKYSHFYLVLRSFFLIWLKTDSFSRHKEISYQKSNKEFVLKQLNLCFFVLLFTITDQSLRKIECTTKLEEIRHKTNFESFVAMEIKNTGSWKHWLLFFRFGKHRDRLTHFIFSAILN